MNNDTMFLFGGLFGAVIATIFCVFIFMMITLSNVAPYQYCLEDEVYAWQQNGGDFPDSETWACVPLDNLIGD